MSNDDIPRPGPTGIGPTMSLTEDTRSVTVRKLRLRVVAGTDDGAVFASTGRRAVVGTHASADLVLHDRAVSRFHCEIRVDDQDRATITDLDSRNGLRVDGVGVFSAPLRDHARLTLGRTELRVELGNERVSIPLSSRCRFGRLVGATASSRAVFAVLERAAASDMTVLLQGETGTGKDLAAESIHAESARRDGPFVVVDCGTLVGTLLESELFGHERGAFTGAISARPGAFEQADGGTIFLDEIGELSSDVQRKILRAVDRREVRRIGSGEYRTIDVRIIAATNRELRIEANAGRFRPDLFYRIAVLEVHMVPLRERIEDLPLLVDDLLDELSPSTDRALVETLRSPLVQAELSAHSWPGNVRELRNCIEQAVATGYAPLFDDASDDHCPQIEASKPLRIARQQWMSYFERQYLGELLRLHHDNASEAARAAGIARAHLYRLLTRHGLR